MLNTSHAVSRTRCAFRFSWLYLISRRYITSRLNVLICTLESHAHQLPARTTAERFSLTGDDENENRLFFFLFRRNNLINDARTYVNIFESTVAMPALHGRIFCTFMPADVRAYRKTREREGKFNLQTR